MKNLDTTTYQNSWDRDRYPVVVDIELLSERIPEFLEFTQSHLTIKMLGYKLPDSGEIIVHIGCPSAATGRWLTYQWAG